MRGQRPIDAASRPDEVLEYVLTEPLDKSDEVRSTLWDFKAELLAEIEPNSRFETLRNRTKEEFISGPYGFFGVYGLLAIFVALPIGYFTANFFIFVTVTIAAFFGLSAVFIRTEPRWTSERIASTANRPAAAARFAAWMMTQNSNAELEAVLVAGIRDSTDYFRDLVVVALDRDLERAERIAKAVIDPQNLEKSSWLWIYAPSIELLELVQQHVDIDEHLVGFNELQTRLRAEIKRELRTVETTTEPVPEPLGFTLAEIDSQFPGTCELPDWGRLIASKERLAVAALDEWRRHPNVELAFRADRALRASIQNHTSFDAKPGQSIEATLDGLLLPLAKQSGRVREGFFTRRERDMISQRRVSLDAFSTHLRHEVHCHVLWGTYRGDNLRDLFRVDEALEMVNRHSERFHWEPHMTVGVVHPAELTPDRLTEWQMIFADFDLNGFDQLGRRQFDAPTGGIFETEKTPSLPILGQLGWSGRIAEEEDDFALRLEREFSWNGTVEKAVIEISEEGTSLAFWSFEGPMSVRLKRPLDEVHPIVVSEALYALHRAISEATSKG